LPFCIYVKYPLPVSGIICRFGGKQQLKENSISFCFAAAKLEKLKESSK